VKTIHATCYKELKMDQSQLVMRSDLLEFGKMMGVHLTGSMPDLFSLEAVTEWKPPSKADRLLQINHLGRHRGLKLKETMKDAPQELDMKYAIWFTKAYRNWKTANGKRDYTDLLQDYLDMGDAPDLDVLFIDEGQDLSWLQWQVVRKLWSNCKRVYICGDPDQTIFRWAGASASLFDLEPADETRSLPHSYRLSRKIHELSQKIIHRVKVRYDHEFTCRDNEGEYRPVGHLDLGHVTQGKTLVLYRNFHRGTSLSLQLEDLAVPFIGANSALSLQEVQEALRGWSEGLAGNAIPLAEARSMIAHANPKYLDPQFKEKTDQSKGTIPIKELFIKNAFYDPWYQVLPKIPRLPYVIRAQAKHGFKALLDPKVKLLSVHQAKGREADTVVLDLEMARKTYEAYLKEPDDEHRVAYVAVTRAKDRLLTLLPTDSMSYDL
jgi:superfamily I DNA/RNA helicase